MTLFGRHIYWCFGDSSHNGAAVGASPIALREQQLSVKPNAAWPLTDSSYGSEKQSRSRWSLSLMQLQHVLPEKGSRPRFASSEAAATAGST